MKRKFGDRRYARRVRDITGMAQISIDLKPNRSVSDVYINQDMDVTKLCEYVESLKDNGEHITYFHAFVAAIGKLIYNRKLLNRFVSNRHVFEHNDVIVSFVAKIAFDDTAEEMMILIKIEPEDNIHTISKKILDKVEAIRNSKKVDKKGANSAIDVLGKLPNVIRIPVVGLLKWLDKKGHLPSSLVEDNIYYSSIIVSNLGSIGCGAILHNINDFGACSSLGTMGEIATKVELLEDGKKRVRKVCPFGINLDERIADGYYFAKSLKMLQYFFDNPSLLEDRVDAKVDMGKSK